jgi:hypothetical protein
VPSLLGRWIVLALCVTLSGCIGYTGSRFDWRIVDTPSDAKTKDAVRERFGTPLRVTHAPENVRISLRGDEVVQVEVLKNTDYGAFCGLIASDGWPGCVSE